MASAAPPAHPHNPPPCTEQRPAANQKRGTCVLSCSGPTTPSHSNSQRGAMTHWYPSVPVYRCTATRLVTRTCRETYLAPNTSSMALSASAKTHSVRAWRVMRWRHHERSGNGGPSSSQRAMLPMHAWVLHAACIGIVAPTALWMRV